MVEKAVILAAGGATRMQKNIEHYVTNNDELKAIRKGEKMATRFGKIPFLDYQILNLIQAGLKKINLVLRPDDTFFTSHYESHGKTLFPEVDISYSFQEIPDGTAHAVLAAESFGNGENFLVLNGDNNYPDESIQMLLESPVKYSSMVAFDTIGFNEWMRQRLRSFAVIKTCDGKLKEIVEKAQNPEEYMTNDLLYTLNNERVIVENRNLISMNMWCFTPAIIEACRSVKRHESRKVGKPGEYELPDAAMNMMQRGIEIVVYYICSDVMDLTRSEDIEIVGEQIQENLTDKIEELEIRYARL